MARRHSPSGVDCVQVCYAKHGDRRLRDETTLSEIKALGFREVPRLHACFFVNGRAGELESVVSDFNKMYKGSLWLQWFKDED